MTEQDKQYGPENSKCTKEITNIGNSKKASEDLNWTVLDGF